MPAPITTDSVWNEIEKRSFAVLSFVTPRSEARSSGIVYVVKNRRFYMQVASDSWKAKYIRLNPNVALNVAIPKRIPLMPWIKIPQATIALHGTANVIEAKDADGDVLDALQGATAHSENLSQLAVIVVTPVGSFATYGVGVPLLNMRDPAKARGRVAVG